MSSSRPAYFPPGTRLGRHYLVEGLVRLAEGRMFYLVNDDRTDGDTRRCGSCLGEDSPSTARICHHCGQPLVVRRYLLSARWRGNLDPFDAFARLKLEHPGLASPFEVLRLSDQLLSVVPYRGEGLMVDEASPLPNHRVLHLAQRVVGVLAWLARQGVRPGPLTRAQLLVSPNGAVRLFDLDVTEVRADPIPPVELRPLLGDVARLLRSYTHVRATDLTQFLELGVAGDFPSPPDFGRAIERRFDSLAAAAFPPTLAAMSDVGLTRQLNEDSWRWTALGPRAEVFAVADGMGGHDGGEVASALAASTICRVARERLRDEAVTPELLEGVFRDAFQAANNGVKSEAERKGNDMGTTLVALAVIDGRHALVANVGDSRAYFFRDGQLHQVSVDHSYVQQLVLRGRVKPEEARHHPQSNILLRTVGTERDVEIDLFRLQLEPGDKVLLCTDGLWGEVDDDEIRDILARYADPRVAARELVRASHHGGGKDNVTVLVYVAR